MCYDPSESLKSDWKEVVIHAETLSSDIGEVDQDYVRPVMEYSSCVKFPQSMVLQWIRGR